MGGENQHQHKQGYHEIFGNTFQTALQLESQNKKANENSEEQADNIDGRVRDHFHKTKSLAFSGEKHDEIIDHPSGDHRVERHQGDASDQSDISVNVPFLPGFFQLLVHPDRACLGCSADGKFHCHAGQAEKKQAEHVYKDKASSTVLTCHPGKFPDISAADGTSRAEQDKSEPAAEAFSLVVHDAINSFDLLYCNCSAPHEHDRNFE